MDRFGQIILVAGFGCFALAFVLSAVYPWWITDAQVPEATIEEVAERVSPDFKDLKQRYPVAFAQTFPGSEAALTAPELAAVAEDDPARAVSEEAWRTAYARALERGRNVYISEGCWHCHSQFVRPVANEEQRFGPVRPAAADNNALQRPVLWGTRRVGPDLTWEGRKRSNDWHVAHFHEPQSTSPGSVMPPYPWFLREGWQVRRRIDPDVADRAGLSPDTSYAIPGIYDSEAAAQAGLQRYKEQMPPSLGSEKQHLFVDRGIGPNARGLSVIAYLQWLGTWEPPAADAGATP
jgi:cbb3-type cytochrome c oxidase subunit II